MTRTTTTSTSRDQNGPLTRRSPRRAARISGISYLVMFALGIFANFVVKQGLVEEGDATATVANISGSIDLFRLGLVAFGMIFVLDIVISWGLYRVFEPVSQKVSLVAAWFRLAYTALLGVALVPLFQIQNVLGGSGMNGAVTGGEVEFFTMSKLDSFDSIWLIGLAVFGVHLVLIGWLANRSGWVSKALGGLLMFAGVAYALDTLARGVLPNYEAVAPLFLIVVALPSMIGEGWLGLWLLLSKRFAD